MSTRGTQPSSHHEQNNLSAAERYEVLDRHGEGVLFVVYRVRERSTLDIYALKALRHSYAHHQAFRDTWKTVATAALHRQLPQIARVHEVGIEENTPYLIEEWLPGHTLEERLRRAPFGRIETMSLAQRMARGLAQLHQTGEVHGDFRPRQVLFGAQSELKITDVGWGTAIRNSGISLVDAFPDAAFYQAPELWSGKLPSPASDIYALGAVLYRMLAGRAPFDGPSPLAIAKRHQRTPALRPSQFNPACSPELEEIALGMLDKNPAHRQPHFSRLLELHQEELSPPQAAVPAAVPISEEPQPESTPEPKRKQPKQSKTPRTRRELGKREFKGAFLAFFWALVAIGLLVGIVMGAMYFWMQGAPPEVRVPDYIGMHQNDAEAILKQKGLAMEIGREVYNPKRPSGTVLSGQPSPGTMVRSGRTVLITVSRGTEPIRMYDFRDLTLEQTKRIMQKHGLRIGQIVNQYDSSIPKNYIISQYPEPGQPFRRNEPISLVVSLGSEPTSENKPPIAAPETATDPSDEAAANEANTFEDTQPTQIDPDELISREVQVNVEIPQSSSAQLVTIVINDATGEHTVYSETKKPGEVVNRTVRVAKTPSSSATVQVYAGGQLLREMRF